MGRESYKIVDTNVFCLDPEALYAFRPTKPDVTNYVIIPVIVLEELDHFRSEKNTERGLNAASTIRQLRELANRHKTSLHEGIRIEKGYIVKVETEIETPDEAKFQRVLLPKSPDNVILMVARKYAREKQDVELVTNDTGLAVKASSFGIHADDYQKGRAVKEVQQIYSGYREVTAELGLYELLTAKVGETATVKDLGITSCYPNEFFRIKTPDEKGALLARNDPYSAKLEVFAYDGIQPNGTKGLRHVQAKRWPVKGITPKNWEQACALESLLDKRIKLVSLLGTAGTGKTLLALAASVHQLDCKHTGKVLAIKPIVPIGNTIGYLPGTEREKLQPWLDSIFDSGLQITDCNLEELIRKGQFELQPVEFIRGRSINNCCLIVEEGQNGTPHELKTIITRVGEHSKIVITGDPEQIDHPHLNARTNGILSVSEGMKDTEVAATMRLSIGERSKLATLAARKL